MGSSEFIINNKYNALLLKAVQFSLKNLDCLNIYYKQDLKQQLHSLQSIYFEQ